MKYITKTLLLLILSIAVSSLTFQSCKKKFDEPNLDEYPVLTTNASISQIKALHDIGDNADSITQDLVFEAIVVSSDAEGNFFKQLIVQDDSAGIEIRIEQSNLYNDYPVGRKVYVKCKGLYVGDFEGNHQLSINAAGDRIPGNMLEQFVVGGALNQTVSPKNVTISAIRNSTEYRNMLVQIDNAQFAAIDTNQTYADAVTLQSSNRTVVDCNGNNILLRSSAYATFVNDLTPGGKGTITAVHSNFGSDAQLYIRDTRDVDFTGARCSTTVGGNLITINTLRAAFPGNAPSNSKVRGYVISDRNTNNIVSQSAVVMDEGGQGGIVLRFSTNHTFNEGDYIEFSTDGGSLSEFNGLLQLENIPNGSISVISSGNAVPAITTTVANLNANAESFESMLIQISGAAITGGTIYSGGLDLSDGTGTIDLFTRFGATFANDPTACGNNLTVKGIMGQFDNSAPYTSGYQVQLRNPTTDITGAISCGGGGTATLTNIAAIRAQFSGTSTTVSGSLKIKGIVISDRASENIFDDNLVIQDSSAAIQVRLTANHSYNLGDEIEIIVTGASLGQSSGLLRLGNSGGIAASNITVISTGNTVTPRIATVAQILANSEAWESSLVQVQNATITGGSGNYGFNTITDASGSMDMYTAPSATFSGTAYPTGTVSVTAILDQFTDAQLRIRNTTDVQP